MPHIKTPVRSNAVGYPMPVALLGTIIGDGPSFMTVAWVARVNATPPMMAVAVGRNHASYEAVCMTRVFSVNFPSEDQRVETDYVGITSAKTTDKSEVFEVFRGELGGAPLIKSCPLAMECRVVETVDLPTNTLFVGEVVSVWAHEEVLDESGAVDLVKARPMLLSMPDNRYWALGEPLGRAWKDGAEYVRPGG